MVPEVTSRVERFHEVLIDEILQKQPEYIHSAFKVAEIYQTLVPYRSHRDALGVEMNGDYEDTLLRLLAGAGDLLILESDSALTEIRKELDSTTPNTGRFRDFASADVRLNQAVLPEGVLTTASSAGKSETARPIPVKSAVASGAGKEAKLSDIVVDDSPPVKTRDRGRGRGRGHDKQSGKTLKFEPAPNAEKSTPKKAKEPAVPVETKSDTKPTEAPERKELVAKEATSPKSTGTPMSNCMWCNAALPDRPNVNYCPYCGTSTAVKPCKACGDEMELAWRYCVTCGTEGEEAANAA